MLKHMVDFAHQVIGAEGTRLLREEQVTEDTAGTSSAEEAPELPAWRCVPFAAINRQV